MRAASSRAAPEDSVIREIETIRDTVGGFTGVISDLGGPTANMATACTARAPRSSPGLPPAVLRISGHMPESQHRPRAAHQTVPACAGAQGRQKVLIASGVCATTWRSNRPEYVRELATHHHTGGYLKIAPEVTIGEGPLSKMMKPGVGAYYRFKELFGQVFEAGGQGTVLDSLLHRRAPGHPRSGHARTGAVAEEERLSRRSSAGLPPLANGYRHRHVPFGQEPAQTHHSFERGGW